MDRKTMILERKIAPPPMPSNIISRTGLLREFNEKIGSAAPYPQIILITSPAGYGKTTFAGQWIAAGKEPGVWFNIDENDNDLHRFFTYVIHALRKEHPDLGKGSLDMLSRYNALAEGSLTIEGILTPLMNELYDLQEPLYLLLDHYHHITDPGIHKAMYFFLENLPENVTPVILSRKEPPWPLHQWRSKGGLLEITEDGLAFSLEETKTYLREKAGLLIASEDINALQEKTEGWVTALQLITGSFGQSPDIGELIRALSGDHQQILRYLTEEALNRQPEKIREFLLDTGGLSRFSPEFCNVLLGREDSEEIIRFLLKENLFIVALDTGGKWFRYHSLFQEILTRHQSREQRMPTRELYRRAGKWFEEEGDPAEAIRAYLKGKDYSEVGEILDYKIDHLWETEGFKQILQWMEQLPEEVRNQSLRLTVYSGYMYLLIGNLEATMKCFATAEKIDDPSDMEALGILETLRTTFHLVNGSMEEGFQSARKALQVLPDSSYFWKISASIVYGDVKTFSGDLIGAYEVFQDAYRLSRRAGNALSTVSAAMNILKVLWMRGELHEARRFAEETLKIAKEEGYANLPRMGVVWVFLGELLREKGDFEEGERCANRGLSLCEPEKMLYGMCCIFRSALSLSRKDYDAGLEYLGRLEEMNRETVLPVLIIHLMNSWKSRLLMEKGEIDRARELMNEVDRDDLTTIFFPCSPPVMNARLLLMEQKTEQGREAVQFLENLPQFDVSRRLMIELLLMKAHLEELSREPEKAETLVVKALKVGKGYGFYQIFPDEGGPIKTVFERLLTRESTGADASYPVLKEDTGLLQYLQRIAEAMGIVPSREKSPESLSPDASHPPYEELVEGLTDRELEILRSISRGLSNVEISNTMHLSIHTVKWHNKNIFGKLGVNNRTQAVARGRELKLI